MNIVTNRFEHPFTFRLYRCIGPTSASAPLGPSNAGPRAVEMDGVGLARSGARDSAASAVGEPPVPVLFAFQLHIQDTVVPWQLSSSA